MSRSILEIEEARSRLQRMADEHKDLSELLKKLRQIKGTLETQISDVEKKLASADRLSSTLETNKSAAISLLSELKQKVHAIDEQARELFSQQSQKVEDFCKKQRGELHATYQQVQSDMEGMREENTEWRRGQSEQLGAFESRHFAELEKIAQAYARARITLESQAPMVDGLNEETKHQKARIEQLTQEFEAKFNSLIREIKTVLHKSEEAKANALNQVRAELSTCREENASQVRALTSSLQDAMQATRRRTRRILLTVAFIFLLLGGGAVLLIIRIRPANPVYQSLSEAVMLLP